MKPSLFGSQVLNSVIATLVGLLALLVKPVCAEPLTVGAPPSLRAAFSEIGPMFEREYGTALHIVYTPSKSLLREIEKGVPIDVFVSAGVKELEYLHKKGLTLNGPTRIFTQTSLVLVMPADSTAMLLSLGEAVANHGTRIALGDPHTSFLGEITARELTKRYPNYKTHSHILYASHSDEILDLIRRGKADVGLVYRANLINTDFVRISDEHPVSTGVQIQFGQAVVSTCRTSLRTVAEQFSDFLMTPRIESLLQKYGFDLPSVRQYDYAREAGTRWLRRKSESVHRAVHVTEGGDKLSTRK
ncbi:MAG TPA: molybdate ABC transporter substrate-binding protein [Nitrospiraceae bacterium]|nr:molybdate ABC transporter substrate-binding protein [Nitrospiraceae bacterium]